MVASDWIKDMKTLYCAVSYVCNERCLFCPCSKDSVSMPYLRYEEICDAIDRSAQERGINNVLLSGGEPTLHPDFFRIIEHIKEKGLRLSLLTNALQLADSTFANQMFSIVNGSQLDVTVAFHSHIPAKHDFLTQRNDSFCQSMRGVQKMLDQQVHLSIKNNIVNYTFRDLPDYVRWMTSTFDDSITLLLCNIDINGTAACNKENVAVSFEDSAPYVQKALDVVIELRKAGHKRNVKLLTTPLCKIDPYYWGFVENATRVNIAAYKVPKSDLMWDVSSDSGPMFEACKKCDLKPCCPGAWRSFRDNYDETSLGNK